MIRIILIVSLLVTSAIAKGMQDRINFKGNFKSDWMVGAGKYHWSKRTWLLKYPLSFLSDGWHFMDAVRVMSLCILVALNIPICHEYIYFSPIILYAVHGLFFETFYRIK